MNDSNATATDETASALHPILREAQRQAIDLLARLEAMQSHATVAGEACEAFKERFSFISAYVTSQAYEVWINVHATAMADVVALRRWLAARGYGLSRHQTYEGETRETHALKWNGVDAIIINVHFPLEGVDASCRYVQVATKEVPVYELRCDGGDK